MRRTALEIYRASNLGQMLGRLMYAGDDAPQATVVAPPAAVKKKPRTLKQEGVVGTIRSVLRAAGGKPLSISEIAEASRASITTTQVATSVMHMPDVVRSGTRCNYRYTLRGGSSP